MSLLMDALKKAEQEKREAAKRLEESKDKIPAPADAEPEPEPPDPTGEHAIVEQPPRQGTRDTMELTLAPMEDRDAGAARPEKPAEPPAGSEEPTLNRHTAELGAEEQGAPPESESVPEQQPAPASDASEKAELTFHGVDMNELAAESGLFEETVQGEPFQPVEGARSYDETLPGVPAAQLAKDIGGKDQPTPVAAETVFSATQSNKRSSLGFKIALLVSCVFLVVAASVGYYYWVTPVTPRVPSPWVAHGIESVAPPSAPAPTKAAPAGPPATSPAASAAGPAAAATTAATSVAPVAPPPAAKSAAEPQSKPEAPQTANRGAPAAAPPGESALAQGKPAAAPESAAPAKPAVAGTDISANEPPPQQIQLPSSAIHISRSPGPSRSGVIVKQAYDDYLAGRYQEARRKYLQALGNDPGDQDALLGMAAIDVKRGDLDSAVQWYTRVLSEDPLNQFARAGLIAMGHTGAPQQSESAVKTMLRNDPDNSFLYFILGNIYAGERDWAQAQQAFFDAYRRNSSSADYAMNLAVSLDHMGQRSTALDYYNVALKLAGKGNASFDPNAVLARIRALKRQPSQ